MVGDASAGELLFDRHFRSLYRFFRNKTTDGIDDLVQDTMLACVKGRDRFRGDASFRTYMFATARRILFRFIEKRQRTLGKIDFGVTSIQDLGRGFDQVMVERGEQRILLKALRCIPVDYQIALELYYWEGMRGPEIATVLDIPEPTARSRIRRGLEQLRRAIDDIHESPDVLASTIDNLERWAASLREYMGTGRDAHAGSE